MFCISNEERIARNLEGGKAVRRFYTRHRPQDGKLKIRMETGQIIWVASEGVQEVVTALVDIKEVRQGKSSKDFEMWKEEAKRDDKNNCFVVFFGKDFKLRTLSIAALAHKECTEWIEGLKYLKEKALNLPYTSRLERYLRTEFYNIENQKSRISLQDVKNFFPRTFTKLTNTRIRQLFDTVDDTNKGEISFDQFFELVKKVAWNEDVDRSMLSYMDLPEEMTSLSEYVTGDRVTLQSFQTFLVEQQQEMEETAKSIIMDTIDDVQRDIMEPYFLLPEFMMYLFSKKNELFDSRKEEKVNQDMNQSMSSYWIATSHNTYLTGDQVVSDSSTEAYARVLRQGCRCIELDCWDGPDELPIIYHGYTLTSKIAFRDVIQTIKEHAFVTSDYPVILSIEQHCSEKLQKKMADMFKSVFGDMLVTAPVDPNETTMPSPEALRGKILIKCKKVAERSEEASAQPSNQEDVGSELDLGRSQKSDRLYLKNPIDPMAWQPHFFALTQDSLCYSELQSEDIEDDQLRATNDVSEDERHLREPWYHGRLEGGRTKAEELVLQNSHLGDGTFLVRYSENFVGDHSLTFWYRGRVSHCRIRTRQEGDTTRYWLRDNNAYASLYALIEYYKANPILSQDVWVKLGNAVPQPNSHERMKWYHGNMSKDEAEEYLGRIKEDGAFLVRPSGEHGSISLSFKAEGRTKHCRIKNEEGMFTIGTASFDNLVDLVRYYKQNYLFRRIKLKYAVTEHVIQGLKEVAEAAGMNGPAGYVVDPAYVSNIHVKAKHSYRAKKDDELTFPKHAIIKNVNKLEKDWWQGDYGGQRQHWFPAVYVEEIEPENIDDRGDNQILGNVQKGRIDVVQASTRIERVTTNNRWGITRIIRLTTQMNQVFELGCTSDQQAQDWAIKISSVANTASVTRAPRKQEELQAEMSNLVVYFRAVKFEPARHMIGGTYNEVSSFQENRMESLILSNPLELLRFHKVGFSRVYPKGTRLDSSNYNPIPMWNHGCQLVSLNYQTADKYMQLNEGRFLANGKCGYLLRPQHQQDAKYDPSNPDTLPCPSPKYLSIIVFGARHLSKSSKGYISPMVEVEIIGCDYDNNKYTTKYIQQNGLNPVWNERMMFPVQNPECALIRFAVCEDMFNEPRLLGQATYPLTCIREGYRSVPLKNGYSEDIELASLLIHMKITKEDDEALKLNMRTEMVAMIEAARRNMQDDLADKLEDRLHRLDKEFYPNYNS